MFDGRFKVDYTYRKELTISIRNVNYNDAITFVMELSTSFVGDNPIIYESSVTLDVQGGRCFVFSLFCNKLTVNCYIPTLRF